MFKKFPLPFGFSLGITFQLEFCCFWKVANRVLNCTKLWKLGLLWLLSVVLFPMGSFEGELPKGQTVPVTGSTHSSHSCQ